MKVGVLTKLKSPELDLPRGRYEFPKSNKICRFKDLISAESSLVISVWETVELVRATKIRVVDPEVSFPTVPHLSNSDL